MNKLLIINPNTTQAVTDRLLASATAIWRKEFSSESVSLHAMTADFGASYISDETSYAVAGHAVLNVWERARSEKIEPVAVMIGCFGDPGLWALKEKSGVKVCGLAEASFIEAARHGPFAVVTGGAKWKPMLERLASALGFASKLQTIHTIEATGAQLAADPDSAITLLHQACSIASRDSNVRSIILGGAGLAGYALRVAEYKTAFDVPVIDSVDAGSRHLLRLALTGSM
jgi:allantoin racemase